VAGAVVRALEQLLDPALVLKRDLEAVAAGTVTAKPKVAKRRTKALTLPTHIFIPDTQVRPGVPTVHLEWAGSYIAEKFGDREDVKLIVAGDWWDMAALSSYDVGTARMEGARVAEDILCGNEAFSRFDSLLPKKKSWEYHFLHGNHEDRITRAVNANAQLDGLLGLHLLDTKDFERHEFKEPVWLDGICYSHFFYNWNSSRPYAGANLETRIKTVGHSFSMGHQQGLKWGRVDTVAGAHIGLVAGSFYLHDEEYRGPQAQDHWRGFVVCNEVQSGGYDPMMISMDYLCRHFEGMRLVDFLEKYGNG
jgi:hypothetical protein